MSAEPFSHKVAAAEVPAGGRRYSLAADARERLALADLLAIPAVEALEADIEVRPIAAGAYTVRGDLRARVVQTDVVTLDPVAQEVAEPIDVTLVPADAPSRRKRRASLLDAVEADGPDLFHGGRIDIGVIVRDHLALGLDPYPRALGTAFPGHVEADPDDDPSPFAALAGRAERGG